MPFLDKGILRTVMAGALLTPARLSVAGRLAPVHAICRYCDLQVPETLGHAAWHCPGRLLLRTDLRLNDFPHDQHPRCTTRCGLILVDSRLDRCTIRRLHTLLIFVAKQFTLEAPAPAASSW